MMATGIAVAAALGCSTPAKAVQIEDWDTEKLLIVINEALFAVDCKMRVNWKVLWHIEDVLDKRLGMKDSAWVNPQFDAWVDALMAVKQAEHKANAALFCQDFFDRYGPSGTVYSGLIRRR